MAQNGQILLSICRSCRHQLKVNSKQSRTFASTPRHQKIIPSFSPSANEELDDIFLTFRKKVFTPWALAAHHRSLIYKKRHHQILLNDPGVTVTLSDGEEIKLMPMDMGDQPKLAPSLRRIATILEESDDSRRWNNLPAFLEGMQMAKAQLTEGWLERITRKANEVGQAGVIIRCAEMVLKTGVTLSDPAFAKELMVGLHIRAADSNWSTEAVELGVKRARQIVLMLDDKSHCGGEIRKGHEDMRSNLCILGTLLEMEAAKAVQIDGGKDVDSKVSDCVIKLLFCWRSRGIERQELAERDLVTLIPLLQGMRLALKLDAIASGRYGTELKERLGELEKITEALRDGVEASANGKPRRGLKMYAKL